MILVAGCWAGSVGGRRSRTDGQVRFGGRTRGAAFGAVLRALVRGLLLPLAALGLVNGAEAADPQPWHERSLVGLEVGPTGSQFGGDPADEVYASRFDGREIARQTKACGGEYLVIWARDGDWAYYDSQLQPKCPGLGKRDVLREAVAEGHRLGLAVIAYAVQQYPTHTLKAHPEWRAVDQAGQPINHLVCFRSGYLDYMKAMLDEMLTYGIDGFHLDMVDQGFGPPHGCWCARCRAQFEQRHGRPMPPGITWDEGWDAMLEFRYEASDRFEQALTAHVRRGNPRVTVDFNYHGNPPFSWEVGQLPVRHAQNGDFVTGETGVWGFSALTVGLNAEFYRAATPGRPFQVAMQRGVRMYHDQTTRPLNDLRWELFTLLAHGAFVTMIDKTGFDGWLDPVAYERFGACFDEVRAKRAHFGQAPVQDVGIYYSARTRDWVGRDRPAEYFMALQGAHKAMAYAHVPWGVVHAGNVTLAALRRHAVLLLPNVGILSPGEVALFRSYLESGGNIIATGLSGACDGMGRPQSNGALESLAGVRLVRTLASTDNWVRLPGAEDRADDRLAAMGTGVRSDWPFLVRGPAAVIEPTTAQVWGELLAPHRTRLHAEGRYNADWPMSADQPVGPAIALNPVGRGWFLTLAASPDRATSSDHHIVEARRLLVNAVRALHPNPRLRIDAPANVEAVVTDDPVRRILRVHLLGYNPPPQTTPPKDRPYALPVPIEDAPMYRATLRCREAVLEAGAVNPRTRITAEAGRVDLVIEDIHEVICLRY
ncbi:MAG: hypothetical protein H7A45_02225 [Verrucomicrobiales bacterium]|nr:hypothetical protein [Verrucomicrobiales bacterium]